MGPLTPGPKPIHWKDGRKETPISDTLEDYEKEIEELQEKYKDNDLFDALMDLSLAIDQVFQCLLKDYEIIKKI